MLREREKPTTLRSSNCYNLLLLKQIKSIIIFKIGFLSSTHADVHTYNTHYTEKKTHTHNTHTIYFAEKNRTFHIKIEFRFMCCRVFSTCECVNVSTHVSKQNMRSETIALR